MSLPRRFSTQSSQYQYWKTSKYFILMVIELRPPVSESFTGSQNFMAHWFWKQISSKENPKLATHRTQSRTLDYNTMLNH